VTYANDLTPANFDAARQRLLAMKSSGRRRHVRITAEHLIAAGASEILALDPAALRGSVALSSEQSGAPVKRDTVGVVSIEGPLAQRAHLEFEGECGVNLVDGYDFIAERVASALADESIAALVVRVDSPGGDVPGIEEAIARMRAAIAEAAKPVLVYVDELAASAGYWLACALATDGVFAPTAARVGCIGVIGALISEARALKLIGIDVEVIAEPEGKAEGHPALPISQVAIERVRSRIATTAGRFFDAVAEARGITAQDVKALDGDVFLAADAQRRRLIDGVQSFEATVALAAEKGREARLKKEKIMADEKEVARLQAFEQSVLKATAAGDANGAIAKIEGLKLEVEQLRPTAAKAVAAEQELAKLRAEKADGELVALVDKAVADGKVFPANRESFLATAREKGGVAFAEAVIANLQPAPSLGDGKPPPNPAKVDGPDASLAKLMAKVGLTDEDLNAAKADGMV
jgi:signal peptide peptidase SppA